MPAQIQRQVAYKVYLSQIHASEYVKQEGWDPNYITLNGKQVSRVNIVATVVGKFIAEDGNYATLTLDDGTDTIRVKAFGPDAKLIKEVNMGAVIRFVGKVKEYNEEVYLSPEIVKEVEPNWLIVHRMELGAPKIVRKGDEEPIAIDAVVEEASEEQPKLLEIISKLDTGDGAEIKDVIAKLGVAEEEGKAKIADLLASGEIFEPKKGRVKVL